MGNQKLKMTGGNDKSTGRNVRLHPKTVNRFGPPDVSFPPGSHDKVPSLFCASRLFDGAIFIT